MIHRWKFIRKNVYYLKVFVLECERCLIKAQYNVPKECYYVFNDEHFEYVEIHDYNKLPYCDSEIQLKNLL